jgi:hypothetical protein
MYWHRMYSTLRSARVWFSRCALTATFADMIETDIGVPDHRCEAVRPATYYRAAKSQKERVEEGNGEAIEP